jgi:hypothetical protein
MRVSRFARRRERSNLRRCDAGELSADALACHPANCPWRSKLATNGTRVYVRANGDDTDLVGGTAWL